MNFPQYFLNIAEEVKKKSKDKNTKIGAVIATKDNSLVSTGYNSFPRGFNDDLDERQERPEKYFWFEHAERNAIYNAARVGVPTKGCTMYLTCWTPCCDCARGIIQAGIDTVYVKALHRKDMPENKGKQSTPKWDEHSVRSLKMFKEAGVKIKVYE